METNSWLSQLSQVPTIKAPIPNIIVDDIKDLIDDNPKAQGPYFAVLDLANMFYSVPMTEDSQPLWF